MKRIKIDEQKRISSLFFLNVEINSKAYAQRVGERERNK